MGFWKFFAYLVAFTVVVNLISNLVYDVPTAIKQTGYAVENTIRGNR